MCDEDFLVSRDFHRLVARGALWIASRTTRRALQFLIIGSSFIIPKAYHSCPPSFFPEKIRKLESIEYPFPNIINKKEYETSVGKDWKVRKSLDETRNIRFMATFQPGWRTRKDLDPSLRRFWLGFVGTGKGRPWKLMHINIERLSLHRLTSGYKGISFLPRFQS